MLYIVGTPIGNVEDLSLRAASTILGVDIVLTEDTRSFQSILDYAKTVTNIARNENQRIVSYYKDVEFAKLPNVIEWLEDGKSIALVSEAGMPIISDPGSLLVKTARKHQIPISVVPGPSALTTAIAWSGSANHHIHFVGFFPKKINDKKRLIATLYKINHITKGKITFVAFESPQRANDSISLLVSEPYLCQVSIARESTKKFEEFLVEVDPHSETNWKGEMTLVFEFGSN
jgi:16S rRNA (cytidine1402-2'-O)-methyltransferase